MLQRLLVGAVVVVGLALMTSAVYAAQADQGTHEGLVVSVQGNRLTMTDKDGKNEHTHVVPADAMITYDGKVSRLQDLKKGMSIKVTTAKRGVQNVVTRIDAKKENR
jgi:hypothetical protein